MEILFLVISLLLTVIIVYGIGRMFCSHNQLVEAYKKDEFLRGFHFMLGILLTTVFFITLVTFNNAYWHLK